MTTDYKTPAISGGSALGAAVLVVLGQQQLAPSSSVQLAEHELRVDRIERVIDKILETQESTTIALRTNTAKQGRMEMQIQAFSGSVEEMLKQGKGLAVVQCQ